MARATGWAIAAMFGVGVSFATFAGEATSVEGDSGKGLRVTSADGRFSMNVRGRIQLRETVSASAPDDSGDRTWTHWARVNTARVFIGGHTVSPDIQYLVQLAVAPPDFKDGTISPVYDAYFDFTRNPNARVRVGQMFVPFDRARTIREFALQLPDRQRPVTEFSLDRDFGVYVYSDHVGGKSSPFAYRAGVFSGGGPLAASPSVPGGLGVVRLEWRPLGEIDDDSEGDLQRREKPGVAIGVAAAYNLNTHRARSTTSTTYALGSTDYAHLAADVVFKWRGFSLLCEVLGRDASVERWEGTDAAGEVRTEWARSGGGGFVQPAMMIGPTTEIAGRWSTLWAADGTDPALARDVQNSREEAALGVNRYLNGHRLKVQAGWTAKWGDDFGSADHSASVLMDAIF